MLDSSVVVSGIVSTITILERCIRKEVGEGNAEVWMVELMSIGDKVEICWCRSMIEK